MAQDWMPAAERVGKGKVRAKGEGYYCLDSGPGSLLSQYVAAAADSDSDANVRTRTYERANSAATRIKRSGEFSSLRHGLKVTLTCYTHRHSY